MANTALSVFDPEMTAILTDENPLFIEVPKTVGGNVTDSWSSFGTSNSERNTSGATTMHNSERVLIPPVITAEPKNSFITLNKWEGKILCQTDNGYVAEIRDAITPNEPLEEIELGFDDVSDNDKKLAVPGAIFYWVIGYLVKPTGRIKTSEFRFRRLPVWTQKELDKAADDVWSPLELLSDEKQEEWARLFDD